MTLSSLLVPNPSNLYKLAIFICHLFINGQFHHGHILYDPKVFDGRLTTEIDSICPVQIPFRTTDISQPSLLPSHANNRTDHILQLIFFDPKYLAEQIDQYKDHFTFYRMFVFSSASDKIDTNERMSVIEKQNPVISSSALYVQYNTRNGLVEVHWASGEDEDTDSVEQRTSRKVKCDNDKGQECSVESGNLFDQTFGHYDRMRSTDIGVLLLFRRTEDYANYESNVPQLGNIYFTNYYFSALNASYIDLTCKTFSNATAPSKNQLVKHKRRKFYSELSLQYETIGMEKAEKLKRDHLSQLRFSSSLISNIGGRTIHRLYPYDSKKLAVIFVYGADLLRRMNIVLVPQSTKTLAISIGCFMFLAMIVLRIARKKLRLRRGSFMTTLLDIIVAFIAGGNLRMEHRFERWFFGILLIGAFFITSIFTGDLLDCVISILNQKIHTFDQLSAINPPFFVNPSLEMHAEHISQLLRRKMGRDDIRAEVQLTGFVAPNHNECFGYVGEAHRIESFQTVFLNFKRDFDVLEESLGDIGSQYYLTSDQYVPDRMLKKIDKTTSSMMENGLNQFFLSFTEFKRKLDERTSMTAEDDDDFQALSFEQLKRPMILLFGICGIAIFIFIAEVIIVRCGNRRTRSSRH